MVGPMVEFFVGLIVVVDAVADTCSPGIVATSVVAIKGVNKGVLLTGRVIEDSATLEQAESSKIKVMSIESFFI
jgi:hypothetical protein